MSKLYLNNSNIENIIVNNLDKAIDNVNKAIYWIGTLYIPNDFDYAQYIYNLNGKNNKVLLELSQKRDNLKNAILDYKAIEKENLNKFSEISILDISIRDNFDDIKE